MTTVVLYFDISVVFSRTGEYVALFENVFVMQIAESIIWPLLYRTDIEENVYFRSSLYNRCWCNFAFIDTCFSVEFHRAFFAVEFVHDRLAFDF